MIKLPWACPECQTPNTLTVGGLIGAALSYHCRQNDWCQKCGFQFTVKYRVRVEMETEDVHAVEKAE